MAARCIGASKGFRTCLAGDLCQLADVISNFGASAPICRLWSPRAADARVNALKNHDSAIPSASR
jgi:hypothetical protein